MTVDAIYWALLTALATWCARQQWWIAQHHKSCHTTPAAELAALTARVKACEEESERLAKNAHDDRDVIGAAILDVALLMRHAGIQQTPRRSIVTKLRKLADDLDQYQEPNDRN